MKTVKCLLNIGHLDVTKYGWPGASQDEEVTVEDHVADHMVGHGVAVPGKEPKQSADIKESPKRGGGLGKSTTETKDSK